MLLNANSKVYYVSIIISAAIWKTNDKFAWKTHHDRGVELNSICNQSFDWEMSNIHLGFTLISR